ncbi:YfhJ family protein [Aquibacillus albus]|uniref:WVELL protein n=1 Tax=Aquibacillus albus TaxID=1168171 RepID=A0ABS2N2X8_9BACI|nr:YfhJ family protein [Aquibacillus albus]MBM7572466.1 hypothetical protein [Aquibacillus albus]
MEEIFERLANDLYKKNGNLTIDEARTWVELLWEDFETTRAKAGREYEGKQMTERIVSGWINQYGPRLHEFANHEKYKKMFNKGNDQVH